MPPFHPNTLLTLPPIFSSNVTSLDGACYVPLPPSQFSRKTLAINCSSSDIDVISPQQRSNLSRIEHAAQLILLHERCLVYPLAKTRIESLTSLPSNLTRSFIPLAMEEDETSSPFTFNGQSLVNNRISVSSF